MMGSGEPSKLEQIEKIVMRMHFTVHQKTYFAIPFTLFSSKKLNCPAPSIFKKSYFFNLHFYINAFCLDLQFQFYFYRILLYILHCLLYRKDSYCLFHLKWEKRELIISQIQTGTGVEQHTTSKLVPMKFAKHTVILLTGPM